MSESVLGGRYRVEARIGSGGMAEVFRGFDDVLNRTVAIKVLLPQFARDSGFVQRFRREAQAAARLNQPNIVGVYDSGADGETQYIVLEFIQGRTLAEFMARGGTFTPMQAVAAAEKIADAIAYAHAQGVIHRDIKPANVMVTRQGLVKVMDFGIARIVAGPDTAPQTSAVLGTAAYLSPQQAQGQRVDGRTDIYSLGVVLYEMLTGRPPFSGDSPVAVAYKQVNEAPVPPSQINPDVPSRLDAVVMRALAKNPANRYQTASEFSEDLERVRNGQEVEATPLLAVGDSDATQVISRPERTGVLPPQEEPPGSGRKVWLGVLIGVLIVAVLAGGGYLLAHSLTGNNTARTPVQVPPVIGLSVAKATTTLRKANLKVTTQTMVTDSEKPGTVIAQFPTPGQSVDPGSAVTITVAKAPPKVPVPNLTTMTIADATTALEAVGLTLGGQTSQSSETIPTGQIISQSPSAGAQVTKGTPVNVVVSTGTAQVTVPDVTCLPFGAAKAQLRQLGLNAVLGGTAPSLPQCPNPNRIAAQDPSAGTALTQGDTVTLFTGSGPSPSPSASP